jgi:hypothetical protein
VKNSARFTPTNSSLPLSFLQGITEGAIGDIVQVLSETTGDPMTLKNVYTSRKVWKNVSTLTFTMNFEFYFGMAGVWNGATEVYNPIIRLIGLAAPIANGAGFLTAPGPGISSVAQQFFEGGQLGGFKRFMLSIGGIMDIDDVLIKTVNPKFSNEVDENGFPIAGSVSIEFETQKLAHRQMFRSNSRSEGNRSR